MVKPLSELRKKVSTEVQAYTRVKAAGIIEEMSLSETRNLSGRSQTLMPADTIVSASTSYKMGDTRKTLCGKCLAIVTTTFQIRDVPLDNGGGKEKDALASICDECGEICGVPHQSLPSIQKTLKKSK